MHISDGVLSPYIIITGWVAAVPALALSVKGLKPEKVGVYGVIAAAFFAGSTIHIPVGPFSMHLILNGIAGLMLGWSAVTVITTGLLLQSLFLGFGGLTVLGVNISVIALPGALMGILARQWMKQSSARKRPWIGSFAGGGTVFISSVLLFVSLSTTHAALAPLAKLVFFGHIPVILIEGVIGYWLVHFLQRVKPSLLGILP